VGSLRPEEEWVRVTLERELSAKVVQHDDGSKPAMYDLRVEYDDGRTAAVEVTAAADAETIEFWNLMNTSGRWIVPELSGGWVVHVLPSARVKRIRAELPPLLQGFERTGKRAYGRGAPAEGHVQLAEELGIVRAFQGDTDFPGSIYVYPDLPIERRAAFVGDTGDPVAEWLGPFLKGAEREDVRIKLADAEADETHAFVWIPGFTPAPFVVVDVLMRAEVSLPTHDPDLPAEISHVWAMSDWASGLGFAWSPDRGWFKFDKTVNTGNAS